ncbi:MAG TPA: NAD(P)H-dependent oxidoreductase subunit E [Candidatus Limnocylindrales bacterium]|nr:NAD(P)H-dependent oxidoreductase subunit E [Candidatus Limnocylindrales bacterium]
MPQITDSHHGTKNPRSFKKVAEILDRFEGDHRRLVAILQAVQEEYRYLPEPVLSYLATHMGIPRAKVFGVATFYAHFSLAPKGKYVIRICDGTACHVNHSQHLIDLVEKRFRLSELSPTSDDYLITLEKVSCLGACGIAPVVVINELIYSQVTPEKLNQELDQILAREGQQAS